jgi:catechol 2,3-dioxygenase-like lactoylglutathione lyase family enzyme
MDAIAPPGLHHVTAIAEDPQRNVDFLHNGPWLAAGQEDGQLRRHRRVPPVSQRPRRTEDQLRPRLTHPSMDAIPGQSGGRRGYATSRSTLIASITTAVAPWTP